MKNILYAIPIRKLIATICLSVKKLFIISLLLSSTVCWAKEPNIIFHKKSLNPEITIKIEELEYSHVIYFYKEGDLIHVDDTGPRKSITFSDINKDGPLAQLVEQGTLNYAVSLFYQLLNSSFLDVSIYMSIIPKCPFFRSPYRLS